MAWRSYMLTVAALLLMTEPLPGSGKVCTTEVCISTAAKMLEKMNQSADPCQDFSEFACGRYSREAQIPDGKALTSTMEDVRESNKLVLLDILNNTDASQPEYMKKIRLFYRSCLNEDQIEDVGLQPYFLDTIFTNDWPTLNPHWDSSKFSLNTTIERYMKVFVRPLVAVFVAKDLYDSSVNSIYLDDGSLGIDAADLRAGRNNSKVRAYETYLVEFAVALNLTRSVVEEDVRDVVDLEIMLANIMTPSNQRYDLSKRYHPLKLEQFYELYPSLDIVGAIRAAFSTVSIKLNNDDKVINLYPAYIKNLKLILDCVSNRTIQNLFGFKYALMRLQGMTRQLREIKLDFDRVYLGTQSASPRWKDCVDITSQIFWQGLSKQFVSNHFSEAAKNKTNHMIDELMESFWQMVADASWLNISTKETAYRKINAMKRKIGYPEVDFDDEYITRISEDLALDENDYYNNLKLAGFMQSLQKTDLASIRAPANNDRWYFPPLGLDAYALLFENEIVFLAGLIQAPFYSESVPDYLNYGALGSIVGQEIIHHFDGAGRHHDEFGNLRQWWTPTDHEKFNKKSSCFVRQYSSFSIDELNATVSGENTLAKTIADIGGLKASYGAYKHHARQQGLQPVLPDLNLSQDKLFFLSYAQMYCEKMTPAGLSLQLTEPYPPGNFRIIGALQNSYRFAKAYNCPRGSYMNPKPRCSLW